MNQFPSKTTYHETITIITSSEQTFSTIAHSSSTPRLLSTLLLKTNTTTHEKRGAELPSPKSYAPKETPICS